MGRFRGEPETLLGVDERRADGRQQPVRTVEESLDAGPFAVSAPVAAEIVYDEIDGPNRFVTWR